VPVGQPGNQAIVVLDLGPSRSFSKQGAGDLLGREPFENSLRRQGLGVLTEGDDRERLRGK
jgi:hypothetical protein